MKLRPVPVTIRAAKKLVAALHRHHGPPPGALFAVACATEDGRVCGVAIIGRPTSKALQDGFTAEVTRVATDETPNACSCLYGAAWRACRALGYRRLGTYTLKSEPGTSLVAAGWRLVGETRGGSWDRPSRHRTDKHPTEPKNRWEAA